MKGEEFFRFVSMQPPFSTMHPRIASFFKDYLSHEKVSEFNGQYVMNTHFPPYPSQAFANLVEQFNKIGDATTRRLFSVTLAVTNRCTYRCWHCYNAGRSQDDVPLSKLKNLVSDLQNMDVIMVTLSGGEPLLREDLEEIVGLFDERTIVKLNTTGAGLTEKRAKSLKDKGLFAVGVSLDSIKPEEHDCLRGQKGAFQTSLQALRLASENGLYPYAIAVATHDFLEPVAFKSFLQFVQASHGRELHVLEPSATGKLAGKSDVLLRKAERQRLLDFQEEISRDETLPILSTFAYLESFRAFGCGAGLTHLYIDGSGEVCPCNLVPLSFGNIRTTPLNTILADMGAIFQKPRPTCIGRILAKHIHSEKLPINPEESVRICEKCLPRLHSLPRFFRMRTEAKDEVCQKDLRSAYNRIHTYYDEFWLKEAAQPIKDIIEKLVFTGNEKVFEAGCGTGFATVILAQKIQNAVTVIAVDLSRNMLSEAHKRSHFLGIRNITFIEGDALQILGQEGPFDIIFSSWVLGYIPLVPFFSLSSSVLRENGRLAFVVHKENSPREPLELFAELVAEDPSVLKKRVWFDFPQSTDLVRKELIAAGLDVVNLGEGEVVFNYDTPEEVLEHLLKSGAGTAYYNAVDPARRNVFEKEFLKRLAARRKSNKYTITHEYMFCIALKSTVCYNRVSTD